MSRIALFSPHDLDATSGNNTTRRRLALGLRKAGHEVQEIAAAEGRARRAGLQDVDLVHALHAVKSGLVARELAQDLGVPYVVSMTGTDSAPAGSSRDPRLDPVLADAGAVLCASIETIDRLCAALPLDRGRCVLVPKGVEPRPDAPPPDGSAPRWPTFLHVAGWRAVKNHLFALEPLARLAAEFPRLQLRFVGPVLDPALHDEWAHGRAQGRWPFSEDAGAVTAAAMDGEYRGATIVLNTSHAEGGANAVLEAMAWGRAVLASDIEGNRAFIRFDEDAWARSNGVLYRTLPAATISRPTHDPEDFYKKARRLISDPSLAAAIGRNARTHAREHHAPALELEAVLAAYRQAGLTDA